MPRRTSGLLVVLAAALLELTVAVPDARAAGLVDPLLRFRTMRTDHFVIYFHQGEQAMAARLAAIVEDVWRQMRSSPLGVPAARTHVVLADQAELANGFATPLPRNIVFLGAQWPNGSAFLGLTDDWLRMVFTHEFTHIAHLDRSVGWARAVRTIFGRTALAFPNAFLPAWQIEGLATYQESRMTGLGRLHAGDFGAITREPARGGWPEPIDLANGGLVDWPDGYAQYAYGAGFHEYLGRAYGDEKLGDLAQATAGRFPYTAAPAFKAVFGKALGELWRDYQTDLVTAAMAHQAPGTAARITRNGFNASGPRFSSNDEIVYASATAHGFPTLNRVSIDGSDDRPLTTRFLGSTAAVTPETIYFDQTEFRRNAGMYSDLYMLDRSTGKVRPLTREARLLDPDVAPDRRALVAARNVFGARNLVRVDLQSAPPRVTTLLAESDTQFNAPRWSPDGRSIVAERHRSGGLSEIILVDVETRAVRVLASEPGSRIVTPAWRPDGRAVVAAVAPQDQAFDLYEFTLAGSSRRLTHVNGGAVWPDVSPDGQTIVFVGYTVDGQDLFTIPYPANGAIAAAARAPARDESSAGVRPAAPAEVLPDEVYRPWPTLLPTSWFPIVESDAGRTRVGVSVAGADLLAYHGYAGGLAWLASVPSGAIVDKARPDWFAYYSYSRWQPVFWVSAAESTSFVEGVVDNDGLRPSPRTDREHQLDAGVAFPVRRARFAHTSRASVHRSVDDLVEPAGTLERNRTSVRISWAGSTAKHYGYSISQEGGLSLGASADLVRAALGADGDSSTVTLDARGYLPGLRRHHVAALRVGLGRSSGDGRVRRTFLLGGPGPDARLDDFSRDAIGLLRGFEPNQFAGTHVALVNADYRLPLFRPQRGSGTWPLFVQAVHAAVFVDAGHAWTRAFRAADLKTSVGAELSVDVVAGYFLPFTVTVGAAAGHDGSGSTGGGAAYVRIGRAF